MDLYLLVVVKSPDIIYRFFFVRNVVTCTVFLNCVLCIICVVSILIYFFFVHLQKSCSNVIFHLLIINFVIVLNFYLVDVLGVSYYFLVVYVLSIVFLIPFS